jgi:hypothetical protein
MSPSADHLTQLEKKIQQLELEIRNNATSETPSLLLMKARLEHSIREIGLKISKIECSIQNIKDEIQNKASA